LAYVAQALLPVPAFIIDSHLAQAGPHSRAESRAQPKTSVLGEQSE